MITEENKKRILIVDDEEIIRDLLSRLLSKMGFQTMTAENGHAAVTAYIQEKGCFDMVILDMIMPVMNGLETFFSLKNIQDSVKVLILSAYSRDNAVQKILNSGGCGYLQKPVSQISLKQEIYRILDLKETVN